MPFYALRVTCLSCGAAFVVGGSAESDLMQWRNLMVECRACLSQTPAADGKPVTLRATRRPTVRPRDAGREARS